MGVRGRIFLLSIAAIVTALIGGGGWLEWRLRSQLLREAQRHLTQTTLLVRETIEASDGAGHGESMHALVRKLATTSGNRITLIGPDGLVMADSEVAKERVGLTENHGQREEVAAAMRGAVGVSRRRSSTLGVDMLYVAVPFARRDQAGVVRAAAALRQIDEVVWQQRMSLGAAGLLALGFAAFMSGVFSHLLSRTIRELLDAARRMSAGDTSTRVLAKRGDELGGLAGSLNQLAVALQQTMSDLAQERDRFRAVLEGVAEAVVAVDADGRIVASNPAALSLLGWASEPRGRALVDLLRQPEVHELFEASMRDESSKAVEIRLSSTIIAVARAARIPPPNAGVVIVLRDVTQLRKLEAVRRDFVANVSHELRTPVSTIRATAETLLDGGLDDAEAARRFLKALVRNADRLGQIVSDLLDLSRIEAGEYAMDLQSTHLRGACLRAVEAVADRAKNKAMSIEVKVVEGDHAVADERALEHVLVNLLDNAVKYTPEGGHVVVRSKRQGAGVRLEVCDDGPGIEARFRDRIFQRFYRLDPGRSRELGGTGLGLAIVRHLVEAMHGSVGMEGNTPHGSVFWVDLPAGPQPPS